MIITYTPGPREYDGPPKLGEFRPTPGEPLSFTWAPNKIMSAEAEAIEDATDWTFEEFGAKFLKGSMKAKRAALWILLKREHPTMRFRDLSFAPTEVVVDFDDEEVAALRKAVEDTPDLDAEQRAEILAALGDEDEDPKEPVTPEDPGPEMEPAPKKAKKSDDA